VVWGKKNEMGAVSQRDEAGLDTKLCIFSRDSNLS